MTRIRAANCPFQPNSEVDAFGPPQRDTDGDGQGDLCECGNTDGSTAVDIFDALSIAQGTLTPPIAAMANPRACDVDGNGSCDIFDALRVAQATLTPPIAPIVEACPALVGPPPTP
ncbi:MAG: dockerin type I domain-containing protein [Myxococcota bacterium]